MRYASKDCILSSICQPAMGGATHLPLVREAAPPVNPPRKGTAMDDLEETVKKLMAMMTPAKREAIEAFFAKHRVTDPMDQVQVIRDLGDDLALAAVK